MPLQHREQRRSANRTQIVDRPRPRADRRSASACRATSVRQDVVEGRGSVSARLRCVRRGDADAEPERLVCLAPLVENDLGVRLRQLQQPRGIQPPGPPPIIATR